MPSVLVTRPRHQQQRFTDLCQSLGVDTVSLPLLKMNKRSVPHKLWRPRLKETSTAWIFTSKNAVLYSPLKSQPVGPVFAMGSSTASALTDHGYTLAAIPDTPFNSEALVCQLQSVDARSAVVVTGAGGRAYLAKKLRSMDWSVTEIACYERVPEALDIQRVKKAIDASDILSLTSIESMDVLIKKTHELDNDWKSRPLIVNSTRAVPAARQAGFTGEIRVAVPAGDDGQIAALQTLL